MARAFDNTLVTKAILDVYNADYKKAVTSDVLIAGAGPSGMLAGAILAKSGLNVTIIEKRLSPGGGVWGGGMVLSRVVVQKEALSILESLGVRTVKYETVFVCDSIELASALAVNALRCGARILNMHLVEDLCIENGRVTGLVVNRTGVYGTVPVDPLMFSAKATLDSTGHDMVLATLLRKKVADAPERKTAIPGEGPMEAWSAEEFVVENTCKFYPGLYITGMAVCAAFGGPRMGPIFGGMLLAGEKAARLILADIH
jgi:thiamine thiazole synthase